MLPKSNIYLFPNSNLEIMKERNRTAERDREATEKRLLDTVGQMIAEEGFEKVGINAIATRSGVSKILIYRYFGSLEGLMTTYIRQHDFWINFPFELPAREELPLFLKKVFREQIEQLRNNPTLRRLYRWELSCHNDTIVKLREQREQSGLHLLEKVSRLAGCPQEELASMASILTASITYLAMLGDFCPVYNGIAIDRDSGWEQLYRGIEAFIDRIFPEK